MTVGIIGFSFGSRGIENEPGPVNTRLARMVEQIAAEQDEPPVIVVQWEIARALDAVQPDEVIGPVLGSYLDSEQVWQGAREVMQAAKVRRVVAVAHPLLHRGKVTRLIRSDGFGVVREPLGFVGYDDSPLNTQWWTRGPVRLSTYALLQALTDRRGH